MGFEYVRDYYGVPAKRGRRVRYTGGRDGPKLGTITAPAGAHVKIRLDGVAGSAPYHPTWELEYLDDEGKNVIWSNSQEVFCPNCTAAMEQESPPNGQYNCDGCGRAWDPEDVESES